MATPPRCGYSPYAHRSAGPSGAAQPFVFYMAGRECDWSAASLSLPLPSTAHPCTSVTIAHQSSRTESSDRLVVESMVIGSPMALCRAMVAVQRITVRAEICRQKTIMDDGDPHQ